MGLFSKKEKRSEAEIPALPRLPRLPDINMDSMEDRIIHQLPSFPSSSIGKKFSQDSIKDAVSGERGEKDFYADEFSGDEMRMMQEPLRRPMAEEMEEDEQMPIPSPNRGRIMDMRESFRQEAEPVFVRIDRFEEGLKLFENVKRQITDIERILAETKMLKEKEEAELNAWGNELKRMKMELENMGKDIFSKV